MPHLSPHTEYDLICQLRVGSEGAFTILFHRYREKVYHYCLRFTRSSAIAEEWLQDTFVQVWLRRELLDPHQSFSGYLHTIARNKALDYIQRESSMIKHNTEWLRRFSSEDHDSQFLSEAADLERITNKAVNLLPSQRRKVYKLSRQEGLSHRDISDQLGLSQGTIKHQIVLSLRFLRRYILDHSG